MERLRLLTSVLAVLVHGYRFTRNQLVVSAVKDDAVRMRGDPAERTGERTAPSPTASIGLTGKPFVIDGLQVARHLLVVVELPGEHALVRSGILAGAADEQDGGETSAVARPASLSATSIGPSQRRITRIGGGVRRPGG